MIRVYHKYCGWYYQWRDKEGLVQERGVWATKEEAQAALEGAIKSGLVK